LLLLLQLHVACFSPFFFDVKTASGVKGEYADSDKQQLQQQQHGTPPFVCLFVCSVCVFVAKPFEM